MTAEPIRAVVLANSAGLVVADKNPDRGPYASCLEQELAVDGVPARVWNYSRVMGMVNGGVRDWEHSAWVHWPELVVIQYGVQESYPCFFRPSWHQRAWGTQRSDRLIDRSLNELLQSHWSKVQWASRRLDRSWLPGQIPLARFERQFNRLIWLTLKWTAAAVVVVGMHPPNFRLMKLCGAYPKRSVKMERVIQDAVAVNPRCGYVEFQRVLDAVDPDFEKSMPDGLHLNQKAHHALARLIAEEYWAIQSRLSSVTAMSGSDR